MKMKKINGKLEVKSSIENTGEHSLYLYGDISPEWFGDISFNQVKYALQGKDISTLNVFVNSNGGDVFESIAIANYLKGLDAKVIIHVEAMAASGMSIIAMAGDEVIMQPNSMMMIHNAWTVGVGNATELRKIADDLEKISSSMSKTYLQKFVGTQEELEQLLEDESYLTAEECLALGLADSIKEYQVDIEEHVEESINAKDKLLIKYASSSKPKGNQSDVFKNLVTTLGGK